MNSPRGLLLAGTLAIAACGSARRSEPIAGPLIVTEAAQGRGRIVFMQHCHKCHPGGDVGLGPSLNDKPFLRMRSKFKVRHAFGAMPSFDKSRISDKELEDLTEYLAVLRSR